MRHWLQANLRLRRRKADPVASARALFAELRVALKAWRTSGAVEHCYFVRKAPDVRLRFELTSDEAERTVEQWLDSRRSDSITSWARACYEPETALLGGPEMLSHVHAYFDADTRAFMEFWKQDGATEQRRAPTAQRSALSPLALSLSVLNDLFARALDSREEIWDVWWNLAALHGDPPPPRMGTTTPVQISDLIGRVTLANERILRAYRRANVAFASEMLRLDARGKLLYGRRSVLPYIALFHWNRYGFTLDERARVFSAMMSAWDPGLRFRGRFDTAGAT